MQTNLRTFVGLVAFISATAAMASHPVNPLNLSQKSGGQPLPTTTIVPTGVPIELTADSDSATCDSSTPTYKLEFEVIPDTASFTGTVTHSSPMMAKPSCSVQTYPSTSVNLPSGSYKWRVRENVSGSFGGVSGWVNFNGGNTAFTIAPPNVPDILVKNVALSNVTSDQTKLEFTVDASFENRGTVSTGNFVWKAYLSAQNNTLDSSDQLIFTATTPVDVPGTTTLTASSSLITLTPAPPPGAYYVIVEADPAPSGCTTNCGSVNEFDEKNNVGAMPNYFVKGVDLVATSISNGPVNAGPGNSITLQVNFYNQGVETPNPNNPVEFRVVASRDQTIDQGDYEVYSNFVNVGGAQVFNMPVTFTLPPGIAGGDVYWGLDVDPARPGKLNPTAEALETNNQKVSTGTTHIQQADLEAVFADLVDPVIGSTTRKLDMGQQGRINISVKNVGDFLANPYDVGVIISNDNTLSLLVDHRFADVPVTGIAAGANGTLDVFFTVPSKSKPTAMNPNGTPLATGDYYFFIQLDSFNTISELNESNNVRAIVGPVRVREPDADYATLRVQTPANAAAGETIALARTFRNIGTESGPATVYRCYASVNSIITADDYRLTFAEASGAVTEKPLQLEAGASDSATELVQLPGNMPGGNYYIGCLVDPDNTIPELEESNNAGATTQPVQIAQQSFRIVTQQLPDAVLGMPFNFKLTAVNATGPVTWTAVTSPPEGLGVSTDGSLTGMPEQVGLTTFRVKATDGRFTYESVLLQRVVPPTSQLTITSANVPPVVNSTSIAYQATLSASGGAQPYTWSIVSGALPGGITLDATSGLLSGNPKPGLPNGESKLNVQVRDALGGVAQKEIRIRVLAAGALAIKTLDLPDTLLGADYIADLAAEVVGGGALAKPLTWSIVSGTLPPGLILETHTDQATGLLSGKATTAGTYTFTVQVHDNDGRADTVDFIVRVFSSGLKVSLATPPPSPIYPGQAVEFQVTSTGVGGTKFRLFSGALPNGLTLAEDGKVSGTVAEEDSSLGVHSFVVEATDAAGGKGLGAFSVEVLREPQPQTCASTGGGASGIVLVALALLGLAAVGATRRTAAVRATVRAQR